MIRYSCLLLVFVTLRVAGSNQVIEIFNIKLPMVSKFLLVLSFINTNTRTCHGHVGWQLPMSNRLEITRSWWSAGDTIQYRAKASILEVFERWFCPNSTPFACWERRAPQDFDRQKWRCDQVGHTLVTYVCRLNYVINGLSNKEHTHKILVCFLCFPTSQVFQHSVRFWTF